MNIQNWFPLGLTGLISLQSKGLSRVFSSTTLWKHQFFNISLLYDPVLTSEHDYWKNHRLTIQTFVGKIMSLLFNILSRLVIAFLQRSKCLLIHGFSHHLQWFWSTNNKVCHCFPIYLPWNDGPKCHDLSFLNVEFSSSFSLSSFTFIKSLFSSS